MKVGSLLSLILMLWLSTLASQTEVAALEGNAFPYLETCKGLNADSDVRECLTKKLHADLLAKLLEKNYTDLEEGDYQLSYLINSMENVSFEKVVRLPRRVETKKVRESQNKLVMAFLEVLKEQDWIYPDPDSKGNQRGIQYYLDFNPKDLN